MLFSISSWTEKAKFIANATYTHAKNLASLVFLYKGLSGLLRWLHRTKHPLHAVISGFISGYFVFGKYNKVNEQVSVFPVLFSPVSFTLTSFMSHIILDYSIGNPSLDVQWTIFYAIFIQISMMFNHTYNFS